MGTVAQRVRRSPFYLISNAQVVGHPWCCQFLQPCWGKAFSIRVIFPLSFWSGKDNFHHWISFIRESEDKTWWSKYYLVKNPLHGLHAWRCCYPPAQSTGLLLQGKFQAYPVLDFSIRDLLWLQIHPSLCFCYSNNQILSLIFRTGLSSFYWI